MSRVVFRFVLGTKSIKIDALEDDDAYCDEMPASGADSDKGRQ
jgi:hypothetical protein